MSVLAEMWENDNKPYNPGGWFCCRTYETLDNPILSEVTQIINHPTHGERRSTFHQYTVNPREIRQRNQDKDTCKLFAAVMLLIAAVAITWCALYLNKYYKIVRK